MASTYVNDLRLNEMATGDASGTWGTVTNTNLELIAEAFSYGTEAITTNADTHTTTIADGATDPGRSIFLKYTGTLDSACTITIGPNTVSKLWFIENGTSGSQNIIISQGSGASITIPAGDTKIVYSDGAGSGAAVVDALASISAVDLKVQDDLTVTDDVAIGGDLDVDGATTTDGITNAGNFETDSGTIKLDGNYPTGSDNVALGDTALDDGSLSGDNNVAIGSAALTANTSGNRGTAVGKSALAANTTGTENVGIGYQALDANSTGAANTAVGSNAGALVTTGVSNTLIGGLAGDALTDADFSVALGYTALSNDTLGSGSTAIGHGTLSVQNFTSATTTYNTAVGFKAGNVITTGVKNTLTGSLAGDNITTGSKNTFYGYDINASAVDVSNEIFIGHSGTGGGANTVKIGTDGGVAILNLDGSDTSWAASSDERLKTEITDSTAGLSFIKDLRPVTFKWNSKDAIDSNLPQYDADSSDPVYGTGKTNHGFIAQEVKSAIDNHSEIKNGNNIWSQDPDGTQQLAPSALVPMLVKAIQEQQAIIESLTTRITALEGE
jgi:hypothetical protein